MGIVCYVIFSKQSGHYTYQLYCILYQIGFYLIFRTNVYRHCVYFQELQQHSVTVSTPSLRELVCGKPSAIIVTLTNDCFCHFYIIYCLIFMFANNFLSAKPRFIHLWTTRVHATLTRQRHR